MIATNINRDINRICNKVFDIQLNWAPAARDVGDGRGGDAEEEEEEGDGVRHDDGHDAGADEGEAAGTASGSARAAWDAIQFCRVI